MRISSLIASFVVVSSLSFSPIVMADFNCPSLAEIQNNAELFNSIYHFDSISTAPNYLFSANNGEAYSSDEMVAANKSWHLIAVGKGSSDDQTLKNAQTMAKNVKMLTSSFHAEDASKFRIDVCGYSSDDHYHYSQSDIIAIHLDGKFVMPTVMKHKTILTA